METPARQAPQCPLTVEFTLPSLGGSALTLGSPRGRAGSLSGAGLGGHRAGGLPATHALTTLPPPGAVRTGHGPI